jgi:hypothetical protein
VNIFEAIEYVHDGHAVRHAVWDAGVALVLRDGHVVRLEEIAGCGSVTRLERLHAVLDSHQLTSNRWEIIPPSETRIDEARAMSHEAGQRAAIDAVMQQLAQRAHNAEVAEFEARILQMQEADFRQRLEETPGTPYGTVLRDIDHHLAHAAEDPALLLLLDKWHTHHAKAILGLHAGKMEGVSRIQRRAKMNDLSTYSAAFHVATDGRVSAYPPPVQRRSGNGDVVYGPGGTQRVRLEQAGEDVLGASSSGVVSSESAFEPAGTQRFHTKADAARARTDMRQVLDNLYVPVPARNARTTVEYLDGDAIACLKRRVLSTLGLVDGLAYKALEQHPSEILRIADAIEHLLESLKL